MGSTRGPGEVEVEWHESDSLDLWWLKDTNSSEKLINQLGLDSIRNVVQEMTEVVWTHWKDAWVTRCREIDVSGRQGRGRPKRLAMRLRGNLRAKGTQRTWLRTKRDGGMSSSDSVWQMQCGKDVQMCMMCCAKLRTVVWYYIIYFSIMLSE